MQASGPPSALGLAPIDGCLPRCGGSAGQVDSSPLCPASSHGAPGPHEMVDLAKYLENAADAVKRRNYALAVKTYLQVLQFQPDYGEAREGLQQALFTKVAQKKPSKVGALLGGGFSLLSGHVLRLLGRHAAAARSFQRYVVADPLSEGGNLALATSLQRAGMRRSALAVFASFAQQQPRCLPACRAAGALLYEQGKLQQALEMYEMALKVDPRDQEALKARKDLAAEGALKSTGIEKAQSARELIKDKSVQQKLEQQQRLQLSPEEIARELDKAEAELQQKPDDVALLREGSKDLKGAVDCLERAAGLAPQDHELLDICGDLRLRLQEQYVQKALSRKDGAAAERAELALQQARAAEYRRRIERNPAD